MARCFDIGGSGVKTCFIKPDNSLVGLTALGICPVEIDFATWLRTKLTTFDTELSSKCDVFISSAGGVDHENKSTNTEWKGGGKPFSGKIKFRDLFGIPEASKLYVCSDLYSHVLGSQVVNPCTPGSDTLFIVLGTGLVSQQLRIKPGSELKFGPNQWNYKPPIMSSTLHTEDPLYNKGDPIYVDPWVLLGFYDTLLDLNKVLKNPSKGIEDLKYLIKNGILTLRHLMLNMSSDNYEQVVTKRVDAYITGYRSDPKNALPGSKKLDIRLLGGGSKMYKGTLAQVQPKSDTLAFMAYIFFKTRLGSFYSDKERYNRELLSILKPDPKTYTGGKRRTRRRN